MSCLHKKKRNARLKAKKLIIMFRPKMIVAKQVSFHFPWPTEITFEVITTLIDEDHHEINERKKINKQSSVSINASEDVSSFNTI